MPSCRSGHVDAGRRRGWWWAALVLAWPSTLVVTACTPAPADDVHDSHAGSASTPSTAPSTTSPAPSSAPATGLPECEHGEADVAVAVFRETFRDRVDAYEDWLGCRVDYVVDFPSRDTWFNIARPGYLLEEWEGVDRRLVLSVAMLPAEEPADYAAGARGAYDEHFRELARRLIDRGRPDAILRIGWEFNVPESGWYTEDPELFRAYWRHIVEAMRSVPGQRFEFTWNLGRSGDDAVPFYPGDDLVDHIGVDVYDATGAPGTYPYPDDCDDACRTARQATAWSEEIYGGDRGLRFWAEFARTHDKPLALPEWGLWSRPDGTGGGANPYFIEQMYAFISDPANNVAYQAYFEYDGDDGAHRLMTSFSEVGDLYRDLLAPEG